LLLDLLTASAPARIVTVSSAAHAGVTLDFDDLQGRRRYRGFLAYRRSKLANLLFTFELARRLEGTGVTANALHPGFVATNIFAGNGPAGWLMRRSAGLFAIDAEQGARTTVFLATAPEVDTLTGRYFVKSRPVAPWPAAQDPAAARLLWQVSERWTGSAGPPRP
ncbi:MAG TPA: SDR family NAD(P)-dependent oxidoreductase, partial [Isosphaeraceae bacterium]